MAAIRYGIVMFFAGFFHCCLWQWWAAIATHTPHWPGLQTLKPTNPTLCMSIICSHFVFVDAICIRTFCLHHWLPVGCRLLWTACQVHSVHAPQTVAGGFRERLDFIWSYALQCRVRGCTSALDVPRSPRSMLQFRDRAALAPSVLSGSIVVD